MFYRPSCADENSLDFIPDETSDTPMPNLQNIRPDSLELMIARTGTGAGTSEDQVPPSGTAATIHHTSHSVNTSYVRVFMNAWGNLLE